MTDPIDLSALTWEQLERLDVQLEDVGSAAVDLITGPGPNPAFEALFQLSDVAADEMRRRDPDRWDQWSQRRLRVLDIEYAGRWS